MRADTARMDTESPTPVPDDSALPSSTTSNDAAPPPRRRSMLGLPGRLTLLLVLAIGVFVVGIIGFADHRLASSQEAQARDAALAAAREAGSQLTEADFSGDADDQFTQLLDDRLAQIRDEDPAIQRMVLYSRADDGDLSLRASLPKEPEAGDKQVASNAITEGTKAFGDVGATTTAAWAITFSDGTPGAVVLLDYDTDSVTAGAGTTRQRLVLGGVIGGALLGVIVLLLLRRELFRPLEEMRRVMAQIRGGAKGARIGWDRTDELGMVANDFDAMVDDLEHAERELAKYVKHDPLTGLLTRDAFTDRFAAELTRARREGYPIALLAIDVDQLDEVNRTHDRAAGDQVLADIGDVIGSCTRPTDACGRTGEDSFNVALVGAEVSQAAVVIQRIRREVAQRVGIGPERTRVTCGFGVAEYPEHAVDQIALERMAEAACSHAQRDGRDRAVAFGPAGGYVDALTLVPDAERSTEKPAGTRELASTVHALARSLDAIDPALGGSAHSQRVARYAAALARDLDLGDAELRELRSAAVLHDIGKVAVPPAILRMSEDQLDDRQRGALRYHAWVSRTMIAGAGLGSVAEIVFHLPERWDGTGYPERLREEKIPLASRILRAAELLDELTEGLGATEQVSPFRAASELKRLAGSELDPDIAVRLARLVREEGLVGNAPVVDDQQAAGTDAAPTSSDAEAA